jgi:hypothetical protein
LRICSGVRPPISRSGSQTTISSSGMPILWPVQRPRCWSGKNSTFSRREGPFGDGAGVGRGAHDAAVLAAEGLEVGRRVDVGDRRDLLFGVQHLVQFAPAALDLGQVGHVGHRAAGGEVGQDGDLVRRGHDVGDFGHEMHAAEDDVFGVGLRGEARELQRVAGQVGVLVDVGALVVVAEDDGLAELAERSWRVGGAMRSWQASVQGSRQPGRAVGADAAAAEEHDQRFRIDLALQFGQKVRDCARRPGTGSIRSRRHRGCGRPSPIRPGAHVDHFGAGRQRSTSKASWASVRPS